MGRRFKRDLPSKQTGHIRKCCAQAQICGQTFNGPYKNTFYKFYVMRSEFPFRSSPIFLIHLYIIYSRNAFIYNNTMISKNNLLTKMSMQCKSFQPNDSGSILQVITYTELLCSRVKKNT